MRMWVPHCCVCTSSKGSSEAKLQGLAPMLHLTRYSIRSGGVMHTDGRHHAGYSVFKACAAAAASHHQMQEIRILCGGNVHHCCPSHSLYTQTQYDADMAAALQLQARHAEPDKAALVQVYSPTKPFQALAARPRPHHHKSVQQCTSYEPGGQSRAQSERKPSAGWTCTAPGQAPVTKPSSKMCCQDPA